MIENQMIESLLYAPIILAGIVTESEASGAIVGLSNGRFVSFLDSLNNMRGFRDQKPLKLRYLAISKDENNPPSPMLSQDRSTSPSPPFTTSPIKPCTAIFHEDHPAHTRYTMLLLCTVVKVRLIKLTNQLTD